MKILELHPLTIATNNEPSNDFLDATEEGASDSQRASNTGNDSSIMNNQLAPAFEQSTPQIPYNNDNGDFCFRRWADRSPEFLERHRSY
jgi:hypothetical protein